MAFAVILIIVLAVLALVGTIFAAKDTEVSYGKNTKSNIGRLTAIYAVVIFLSILVIGAYIFIK
ncbi:hypothetical protein [Metabacillus halosaccharovorans]|uniref:Group-specific protein n=1 Tax=Metabacillus halosaccharovorans TaxID=930124 RepID=A0ABT3DM80_9BACI|nr:hypothetical protein [Metabacillus halosaccharovorans]MCV9887978.1 hypothetical protein [Metabacillus halosaccharovorans]